MDLDGPAPSKGITFSSENKGKRSAANLPVEAEDNLPWCDYTHMLGRSKVGPEAN